MPELEVETRTRFRAKEEPPEGWRFLRFNIEHDHDAGGVWGLWTEAPVGELPHAGDYQHKWIEYYEVPQRRYLTEWEDG